MRRVERSKQRNKKCQEYIYEYISKIEKTVNEGIEHSQIKKGDAKIIASEIYGLIFASALYKMNNRENFSVMKLYNQYENTLISGLKV